MTPPPKEFPKDYAALAVLLADVLPGADLDEAADGQVVIWTNHTFTGDMLTPIPEGEGV